MSQSGMGRRVRFHPAAQLEIDEAADFYDLEGPGLGSVFLDAVERSLKQVSEFPHASPITIKHVRKKLVSGFPYAAMYSEIGGAILVLALAHHSRRPFYWRGRE